MAVVSAILLNACGGDERRYDLLFCEGQHPHTGITIEGFWVVHHYPDDSSKNTAIEIQDSWGFMEDSFEVDLDTGVVYGATALPKGAKILESIRLDRRTLRARWVSSLEFDHPQYAVVDFKCILANENQF